MSEREIDRGVFQGLQASIDPNWVAEALAATGTATLRRRRFPAEQAIWLVLGMALFRDLSIVDVVKHLALVLPKTGPGGLADSAVMQARARLGASPLRWLFEKCAGKWAKASADRLRWRGLAVYGVDGTTVRVPDSPENRKTFGGQDAGAGRGTSGYPIRKNHQYRTVKRLGAGDALVEVAVDRQARSKDPLLPERWALRAIRYRRRGFQEQTLLTSLLDPVKYPRDEIVAIYHERWELELGYDEVKTEMLEREESIRSKSPEGVEQELWGIALAYNLVRLEMERAAEIAQVRPRG